MHAGEFASAPVGVPETPVAVVMGVEVEVVAGVRRCAFVVAVSGRYAKHVSSGGVVANWVKGSELVEVAVEAAVVFAELSRD